VVKAYGEDVEGGAIEREDGQAEGGQADDDQAENELDDADGDEALGEDGDVLPAGGTLIGVGRHRVVCSVCVSQGRDSEGIRGSGVYKVSLSQLQNNYTQKYHEEKKGESVWVSKREKERDGKL